MRRIIAERLLTSKSTIPHFYLFIEIDAGPLMKARQELNAVTEAERRSEIHHQRFRPQSRGQCRSAHPAVNASFAGDAIIQYGSIHLSVAVAVEEGLITPVIRDAQKKSLREISEAVKDLAARARSKKLKPEEYAGGTITVSNLGAYGIESFSAIINPPQALILSVGAIVKKPVVNHEEQIVVGQAHVHWPERGSSSRRWRHRRRLPCRIAAASRKSDADVVVGFRKGRGRNVPGSALVPSAGFGVTPKRTFLTRGITTARRFLRRAFESSWRRDAATSTRDECATRSLPNRTSRSLIAARKMKRG
jgi:hypothetical protein